MRYFGILACAALALPLAASAQTPFVTNSVQQTLNVNDPLNHAYQQQQSTSCSTSGNCEIIFPKTLHATLIQHVSCIIVEAGSSQAPTNAALFENQFNSKGSNQLPVFLYGANTFVAGDFNFGINTDAELIVSKGDQPTIEIATTAGTLPTLQCTLTGYHN